MNERARAFQEVSDYIEQYPDLDPKTYALWCRHMADEATPKMDPHTERALAQAIAGQWAGAN